MNPAPRILGLLACSLGLSACGSAVNTKPPASLAALRQDRGPPSDGACPDAEGYQELLKFVMEHKVTSWDELPGRFQEQRAQLEAALAKLHGQEGALITALDLSLEQLLSADNVLKNAEAMVQETIDLWQKNPEKLTAEEQQQQVLLQTWLTAGQTVRAESGHLLALRTKAQTQEEAVARLERDKAELLLAKGRLSRELLVSPADDELGRKVLLERLAVVHRRLVAKDLELYKQKTLLQDVKDTISSTQATIAKQQKIFEDFSSSVASLVNADLPMVIKQLAAAREACAAVQKAYQNWLHDVQDNTLALAQLSRLEAFFAQKRPALIHSEALQTVFLPLAAPAPS